jgi:hypothetical protein
MLKNLIVFKKWYIVLLTIRKIINFPLSNHNSEFNVFLKFLEEKL